MTFKGYVRKNGTVGIRNHVIAIPTVFCVNGAVDNIAKRVPGVVGLPHSDGCDTKRVRTPYFNPTIMNLCRNPNIYGAVIVTLGCEPENAKQMAEELQSEGIRCYGTIIQQDGGGEKVIEACCEKAREFLAEAENQTRQEVSLEKATIGLETPFEMKREDRDAACAGSQDEEEDALAATNYVARWFRAQGANVILPTYYRYFEHMRGDKEPIQKLGYAECIGDRKGFFVIEQDGPRFKGPKHGFFTLDPAETFLGEICSGAQMSFFASGKTLPLGFPAAPVLKYCSGEAYEFGKEVEDADFGGSFSEKVGEYCVKKILDTMNGEQTYAEVTNGSDDMLSFLRRSNWY
ncbi:MAG TPA: UxaA family hydrolase [Terriglobales bacterium]|nr:UxaA family hydrolase [Terriglobales bacterium]